MISSLVRELRARGVGVGMQEVVALAGALVHGLHESSLEQFYRVARSLLIHDESDFDEDDFTYREKSLSGLAWLVALRKHFTDSVWLNPDPPEYWRGGTAQAIGQVFPMFPLTLAGLDESLRKLNGR